ncbi:hypothetical protein AAC387_Pa07g1072 [Persea americana]
MEASLSINVYVLSEDGVEGLELIIQYHVGVLSEGRVEGLQLHHPVSCGFIKGFLTEFIGILSTSNKERDPCTVCGKWRWASCQLSSVGISL